MSVISKYAWEKYPDISVICESLHVDLNNGLNSSLQHSSSYPLPGIHSFKSTFQSWNQNIQQYDSFVSEQTYQTILNNLSGCGKWIHVTDPKEIIQYNYNIESNYPVRIKTLVDFSDTSNGKPKLIHFHRTNIFHRDVDIISLSNQCPTSTPISSSLPSSSSSSSVVSSSPSLSSTSLRPVPIFTSRTNNPFPDKIRFSLNWECALPDEVLPHTTETESVTIKQPVQFLYNSTTGAKNLDLISALRVPIWSFNLCKLWVGKTRSEAEMKQKSFMPIYQIECECPDVTKYMKSTKKDLSYIVTSLMLKTKNMIDVLTDMKGYELTIQS